MTTLILLGGCFWGMEYALRDHVGVATEAGYAGGPDGSRSPTYYNLDASGHSEAVRAHLSDDADLKAILAAFLAKSDGDPSPPSHPRYRRGILCPDAGSAETVRNLLHSLGSRMNVETVCEFHRADPYHQGYYIRVLGD